LVTKPSSCLTQLIIVVYTFDFSLRYFCDKKKQNGSKRNIKNTTKKVNSTTINLHLKLVKTVGFCYGSPRPPQ